MSLLVCAISSLSQDTVVTVKVDSIATKPGSTGTPEKEEKSEEGDSKKDQVIAFLEKLDLEKFDKKSTGDFLKALPVSYKLEIQPSDKRGYTYRSYVSIPGKPYVEIYLYYRGFQFTNPNSFFKKKQQRQVKMERMSEINIYNEFLCINGCDD